MKITFYMSCVKVPTVQICVRGKRLRIGLNWHPDLFVKGQWSPIFWTWGGVESLRRRATTIDRLHKFSCWLGQKHVYWPRKLIEAVAPQQGTTLIECLFDNMQMVVQGYMLHYLHVHYDPGEYKDFYYMNAADMVDNEFQKDIARIWSWTNEQRQNT